MQRPRLRPISTWIVGGALLLTLLIATFSGLGAVLIWVGLFALVTGVYVFAFRRGSWARLPRSRTVGGVVIGVGALVLIVGATMTPGSHSTQASESRPGPVSFTLRDWNGSAASAAVDSLSQASYRVRIVTEDGTTAPGDLAGWIVESESPAPGSVVDATQQITLTVRRAITHTATPRTTSTPTPTPVPTGAAQPLVGNTQASPQQSPPSAPPQPAPVQQQPAPPAASTTGVDPGGFCSPSQVGQRGVGTNGRTYICGGKGQDASGHYHWNVP